jgi:alkanesulfonate monooxygenase SsuD/methylene tetrahydromethanopterin reductase-like flavin-dependent oxidoreductase (luciferase family)
MVVPYRNPVVQAKMLGSLDVLSNGRMILGTGTGHVRGESDALGLDFDVRARAHDEYLRIMKAVLSSEEVSFEGEFFRFGPIRTLIRSVQQPHPPIWIGGHGRRALRRAAELGDGWLPSSLDPDALARGIDELREACAAIGREDLPTIAMSAPNRFRFAGRSGAGRNPTSPDDAIGLLTRYRALGVEHVSLGFAMPSLDVYLEQIAFFAREVMPALA